MRTLWGWCKAIINRTHVTSAWFNANSRYVHFCLGTGCDVGPWAEKAWDVKRGGLCVSTVDRVVRRIQSAKMRASLKDRILSDQKKAMDDDARSAVRHEQEDKRPARLDRLKHTTNKVTMGRHSRPQVLVP